MSAITIEKPDQLAIASEMSPIIQQAKSIAVVDQPSFDAAAQFVRRVKTAIKTVKDKFASSKTAANQAHKEICKLENELIHPLEAASLEVEKKSTAWYQIEQDRIREETRIAQEAAQKAAEEARLQEAIAAEQAGDVEHAETILDAPTPQVAVIASPPPKAAGTSVVTRYKAQVTSIMELCRAVADGKASPEYVEPNMTALNRVAGALKETMSVPGVVAVPELGMRSSRI